MHRSLTCLIVCLLVSGANPSAARERATHFCRGHEASIVGTAGDDELTGTIHRDVIVALRGIDHVVGRDGNDVICLGRGGRARKQEVAQGGAGADIMSGGPGEDTVGGSSGHDIVFGGPGEDLVGGSAGHDVVSGGPGEDLIDGWDGSDTLRGGGHRDRIYGRRGQDELYGQGGSDILIGSPGNDLLSGGRDGFGGDAVDYQVPEPDKGVEVNLETGRATGVGIGIDRLVNVEVAIGTEANDRLIGGAEDNTLIGLYGHDLLRGGAGDDCLTPGGDSNRVFGGEGFDYYGHDAGQHLRRFACKFSSYDASIGVFESPITVDLEAGSATGQFEVSRLNGIEGAFGTPSGDKLRGDDANNYFYGGPGNDSIEGRAGDDFLNGTSGKDTLDGGEGTDECVNGEINLFCE